MKTAEHDKRQERAIGGRGRLKEFSLSTPGTAGHARHGWDTTHLIRELCRSANFFLAIDNLRN